jgi:hypothetical protein
MRCWEAENGVSWESWGRIKKREEAAGISDSIYVVLETVAEDCAAKQLARPGISCSSLSAPSGA